MDPPTWHSEQKATVEAAADTGLQGGHLVTPQLAAPSGTPREAAECEPSGVLRQPPNLGPPGAIQAFTKAMVTPQAGMRVHASLDVVCLVPGPSGPDVGRREESGLKCGPPGDMLHPALC